MAAFFVTCLYKHIPEPTLFNPEDGGGMFIQNVGIRPQPKISPHSDNVAKYCATNNNFCDVTVIKVCTALKIVHS
jgi:hypothetical protein